jgi:peptidoglycan/xylan/chitin deacetylase (PgdA/CDA1 family)
VLGPLVTMLSPAGRRARLSTLIFHRVLREADPLFPDETDAHRFDAICGWIARWFNVLPLDEAVARLRAGSLPARALAITFDDGYADNHDIALPILARHRLPATFFIATGFLDGGRMWNDTVIESVRQCRNPLLDLSSLGVPGLVRLSVGDAAQRRSAIDAVLRAIKYLPIDTRADAVLRLASMAGAKPPDDLMMSSTQLRALRRAGMQIGAHTVSHPILASLPDEVARREMSDSKRHLETLLGEPVTLFAYPNGRPATDFNERTVRLAREVGFEAAVTTAKGVAGIATDCFQIPRYTPWDRTRLRFGAKLLANLRSVPSMAHA